MSEETLMGFVQPWHADLTPGFEGTFHYSRHVGVRSNPYMVGIEDRPEERDNLERHYCVQKHFDTPELRKKLEDDSKAELEAIHGPLTWETMPDKFRMDRV